MKYKILFFLLLFNLYSGQTNIQLLYEVDFKPVMHSSIIEKELFALDIDTKENKSIFYSYARYQADSLYQIINRSSEVERNELRKKIPSLHFNIIIGKDFDLQKVNVFEQFNNNVFSYKENYLKGWQISSTKKDISGYSCRLATIQFGGRVWEAWFTEQLNFPDGPFKFSGLPGLILEIESVDGDYKIKMKSLKNGDYKFVIPKNALIINRYKLLKLKREYVKSPSATARQEDYNDGISGESIVNGKKVSSDEAYKILDNELWDWMKGHNNPMEKNDVWIR